MKTINLILLLLTLCFSSHGQQSVTISTGTGWTDTRLYKYERPGYEYTANTNYENSKTLTSSAWSASGYNYFNRTLLRFDLSQLPANAVIGSATLYFYSDPTVTGINAWNGNSQLSGSNAIYLEKVTQNWNAGTVTWNNQPTSTTTGRVWVSPSASTTENITIDIKDLVQDWVVNPSTNHGIKMFLETELKYRSRNYVSIDHNNSNLHPKLVITYTTNGLEVSNAFSTNINQIFEHVDRSASTTGLLLDYGISFVNIEAYNGVVSDTNYVDYSQWQNLYTTLYSMQFRVPANLQVPKGLSDDILSTAMQDFNVIPIVGLHYKYEKYRDDAVSQNLVYISNDQIYDVPGRTQSPFETTDAFAFTPKRTILEGSSHTFKVFASHFYSNTGNTISQFQGDFDDGMGYRTLNLDQNVSVNFSSEGEKTFRFKVTYTDNTSYECRSKVKVSDITPPCTTCRYTGGNVMPFTATRAYAGDVASAMVTIETADAANVLDKPLIVVEGFDAWKILTPDKPGQNFDYSDLINDPDDPGSFLIDVDIDYTGQTLNDALEEAGYDLVFIDFDDGTTYIQRNAYLVEEIIAWVNDEKANATNPEPNVVLGMSMGGLVARYALRDMELQSQNHDTRLYISHDAPHQGANVPLGLQAAVRNLFGKGFSLGLLNVVQIGINSLSLSSQVPSLGRAFNLLETPAAKQMLSYQISGIGDLLNFDYSQHSNFTSELQTMGYPQQTRNIAIANGSECGINQGFSPGALLISGTQKEAIPYLKSLGFLLGTFSNYPQSALFAGVFATKTDLKLDLKINALADHSSNRVYYSKLYIKRKILFVINSNTTLFTESFDASSSMLPLDNASGGVYDVQEFGIGEDDLPGIIEPRFGFVPTYSSLDMGAGTASIQTSDLFRIISPISPPQVPKNIPFDNFFSNPEVNELHTQFTLENGRWLMDELENGGAFYSCVSACATDLNVEISGLDQFCSNASAQYNIPNLSSDASVVWSISGPATINGSNSGNQISVDANGNGTATISATITFPCGGNQILTKSVDVGAVPVIPLLTSPAGNISDASNPTNVYFDICVPYGSGNIHIDLVGVQNLQAFTYSSGAQPQVVNTSVYWSLPSSSYSGALRLEYDVDCGHIVQFVVFNNTCYPYLISPNPATDMLVVESVNDGPDQNFTAKGLQKNNIELKLYNKSGEVVLLKNSDQQKTILNTSGLPNGLYYLHIIDRMGNTAKKHIVIVH